MEHADKELKSLHRKNMRVIAGELKGRRLSADKGRRVRPTADRTKESVFNILSPSLVGAEVLDLFSGTGALAIEAISRGAVSAVLIDAYGDSLAVIRKNISACGLMERTQVIRWHIERNLDCLRNRRPPFDLVFMDPPYAQGLVRPALKSLQQSRCLAPDAQIVIEHGINDPLPDPLSPYSLADQRRYGKTLVSFLSPMV